ncbi:hypothetical protein [Oceanithermus sp.]
MKRIFVIALLLLPSLALGQGVRSLGMGGVTLPGPWATIDNPAYAAYPADSYGPVGGISLPVGLINLALRPSISPIYYFTNYNTFQNNFDFIAFLDQAMHPYEFTINPPRSPDEVVFHISSDGVSITDGAGNPLRLGYSTNQNGKSGAAGLPLPQPFLEIPIPTDLSGFSLRIGAYASAGGFSLNADDNLTSDLAKGNLQPNTTYSITASAAAEAGFTGHLSFAMPLPSIPGFEGRVYVGGQLEGFYGLLRGDAKMSATTTTDSNGIPGPLEYSSEVFYVYPGIGSGFGGRIDLGAVVDYRSGTFGLGIRNLIGYEQWNGKLRTSDANGNVNEVNKTITTAVFNPAVYLNGAYSQKLETGDVVLYGADASYVSGSFAAHAGVEYQKSIFRIRGGFGYEDGIKLGFGGGISLPHFGLDAALTSHQAPFTGQMVFGIAASLSVYF